MLREACCRPLPYLLCTLFLSGLLTGCASSSSPANTTPLIPTTTRLTPSASTVMAGTPVSLVATVNPTSAVGSLTFLDGTNLLGTAPLLSGQATLTTFGLGIGSHRLIAAFAGNNTTAASSSPSVALTVSAPFVSSAQSTATFSPIHPPAAPLITRAPYVNTWLGNSSGLATDTSATFWDGTPKTLTGYAVVDGKPYRFFGNPPAPASPALLNQTSLVTTPTQSIFTFQGAGIQVLVDFLSPVEASDLQRLSIPLSYISSAVQSIDGASHTVSLYFDIAGEWAHGTQSALIQWKPETIALSADGTNNSGNLSSWIVAPSSPVVFQQTNNYPSWGNVLWATPAGANVTVQSGSNNSVRSQFLANGVLTGVNDTAQPRAIDDNNPVFAFSTSFGTVTSTPSAPFVLLLGHARDPGINFMNTPVRLLWTQYFANYEAMLAFAANDFTAAQVRANTLDAAITGTATEIGGPHYAALTALALRQTFASTELTGTPSKPSLYMEEISSDDNIQSDVIYPAVPLFLYLNPNLVGYLIQPVLDYVESGQWPQPFAPHDIGSTYPNALGHNNGGGENMPVESTSELLLMADIYMAHLPPAQAAAYGQLHYPILKQWATYLLTVPPGAQYSNGVDPQYQLGTTDALGPQAHNINLALKGIEAIGAMGQIASMISNSSDAAYYTQQAQSGIAVWQSLSQNNADNHLLLAYREPANQYSPSTTSEGDNQYSLKYNLLLDRMLGLNLVPPSIRSEEANYYRGLEQPYGVDLELETIAEQNNTTQTRFTTSFWEMWTAAALNDPALQQALIDELYSFADRNQSGRPFPDRYNPDPFMPYDDFEARPVVGGLFAPFLTQTH